MKKQGYLPRQLVLLFSAFLALFLIAIASAQAQTWSCTHGHTGSIQYTDRLVSTGQTHAGWGLDFRQKPGSVNWVHLAAPSGHELTTRYVALQFWTSSLDAIVDKVHVYNLANRLVEFEDLGWSGPGQWFTEVLDLGDDYTMSALGISVEVAAGVEAMSHRFIFTGACALLES